VIAIIGKKNQITNKTKPKTLRRIHSVNPRTTTMPRMMGPKNFINVCRKNLSVTKNGWEPGTESGGAIYHGSKKVLRRIGIEKK